MGGAQSTINPSLEWVAVRDLYRFFDQSIPVDCLPCLLRKKRGQIRFYLRCLKKGRVKKKLLMYCKEKTNGNFRIYKAGTSRNPIGYIKKGRYSYKVLNQSRGYSAKIQVRRKICGVYDKITTKMVIPGHRALVFVSSREQYANPRTHKERRLDCLSPCSLLQAFCFGILAQ